MSCPTCGNQLLLSGQKFCARWGGDLSILLAFAELYTHD